MMISKEATDAAEKIAGISVYVRNEDNTIHSIDNRCCHAAIVQVAIRDSTAALRKENERLMKRLDALQPGTIERITDGLWTFAEQECEHNPVAAHHALTTVIETVRQLKAENERLKAELSKGIELMKQLCAENERLEKEVVDLMAESP